MPEGMRALEAAGRKFGIAFKWDELPWSCDYYAKHGRMMPEDWVERIDKHDCHLLRRRRLAGDGARSRLALGLADPVASRASTSTSTCGRAG